MSSPQPARVDIVQIVKDGNDSVVLVKTKNGYLLDIELVAKLQNFGMNKFYANDVELQAIPKRGGKGFSMRSKADNTTENNFDNVENVDL